MKSVVLLICEYDVYSALHTTVDTWCPMKPTFCGKFICKTEQTTHNIWQLVWRVENNHAKIAKWKKEGARRDWRECAVCCCKGSWLRCTVEKNAPKIQELTKMPPMPTPTFIYKRIRISLSRVSFYFIFVLFGSYFGSLLSFFFRVAPSLIAVTWNLKPSNKKEKEKSKTTTTTKVEEGMGWHGNPAALVCNAQHWMWLWDPIFRSGFDLSCPTLLALGFFFLSFFRHSASHNNAQRRHRATAHETN